MDAPLIVSREKENAGSCKQPGAGKQAGTLARGGWQPARAGGLTLDVRHTPPASGTEWARPPVSCPSRLQHSSPARQGGSGCFDPFAAPDGPPGCTPLHAPPAARPVAPPAVQRKPAADGSPPPAVPLLPAALAGRIQSCPPERMGRRGSRPVVRLRVKRSLNGAVAAAGAAPPARALLDGAPPAQLAGCSRKRIEAELLSPPVPRKSSRTLLDEQQAADMISRLQLGASHSGDSHSMPCWGSDGAPQPLPLPPGGGGLA